MLIKNLALLSLVVFAAGCGIEAKTYVMDKPRVGIDLTSGNGGCIYGKCPPQTISKPTRRTYVLELTRPVPESEVQKLEQTAVTAIIDTPSAPPASSDSTAPAAAADSAPAAVPAEPVIPVIGDQPAAAVASSDQGSAAGAQTYTVQKDDTLQKISKKLFGSYGKWYKIYEANKDKIKNPNFVKPGTVLNIPAIK